MQEIAAVASDIEHRRQSLVSLIPKNSHKTITIAVQRAFGALGATAQLLPEIVSAAQNYTNNLRAVAARNEQHAAMQAQRAKRMAANSASKAMKEWASAFERTTTELRAFNRRLTPFDIEFPEAIVAAGLVSLLRSAEAVANGRDADALKHLGKRIVEGTIKWGSKLLPVRYEDLKDLVDAIQGLKDVADAGKATKLRKQQARIGSDFLTWIDAIVLLSVSWSAQAQRFLLATQGKGDADDREVLKLVEARVHACAVAGWPPPSRAS